MAESYVEILREILTKRCSNAVKFFKKTNFSFMQRKQAEEELFNALNAIVSENGNEEQIKEKAKHLLDTYDKYIESSVVQEFWERIRLREEKATTRYAQHILVEKKKQRDIEIECDVADEHRISSKKLLLESAKRKRNYSVHLSSDEDDEEKDEMKENDIEKVCASTVSGFDSDCKPGIINWLKQYRDRPTTSEYDPARSYILDLTPDSNIIEEFSHSEWAQLVEDKCVDASSYLGEVEGITDKLFGPTGAKRTASTLEQTFQQWEDLDNLPAPPHDDTLSYEKDQWKDMLRWAKRTIEPFFDAFKAMKNPLDSGCGETEWLGEYIVPLLKGALKLDGLCRIQWGEISCHASQDRRNHCKDRIKTTLERARLADLLCTYGTHELMCLLVCGGPYNANTTKLANDQYHLQRMMKDMLDALHHKFHHARLNATGLYVLGVQVYMADVKIYTMERRDIYHLQLLKTFHLPLSFVCFHSLRVAIQWAWCLRGLTNDLIHKLNKLYEVSEIPPSNRPIGLKTPDTPRKSRKTRPFRSVEDHDI